MNKLYTTLITLTSLLHITLSQASDALPDIFIEAYLDGCTEYTSKETCLCEAEIRYNNLSDKEKGLVIIILEIDATSPTKNNKKLYKSAMSQYDHDGSIYKSVLAKKERIETIISDKCNI